MKKVTYPFIYVSDLHIKTEDDERGRLFLQFLASLDCNFVKKLVLLGDVFEFFLGTRSYFHKKFFKIGASLESLVSKGVDVVFVQGNHEFFLENVQWKGISFVSQRDFLMYLSPQDGLMLTHGDQLDNSFFYQSYLRFMRSTFLKYITYLLPVALLDVLCLKIAERSRMKSAHKKIPHKKILEKIISWVEKKNFKLAVVGHFHVPYDYVCPQKNIRVLGLDSWEKPSFLAYDGKKFCRVYLDANDRKK